MNNSISPSSLKDRIHSRIDNNGNHDTKKSYNTFLNRDDRKIIEKVKDEDLRRIYSDGDNINDNRKPKNFELPSYDSYLSKKRNQNESDTK